MNDVLAGKPPDYTIRYRSPNYGYSERLYIAHYKLSAHKFQLNARNSFRMPIDYYDNVTTKLCDT